MTQQAIDEIRAEIDEIDGQLLERLSRRAELAVAIGPAKQALGRPIHDPGREAALLARLAGANPGPLPEAAIRSIFQSIVRACRNLEQPSRVACLGPVGTFSNQAALRHFGPGVDILPQPDLPEVAEAVVRGEVDFGILPVENSIEGVIGISFDLLAEHGLYVVAERVLPIHLHLIGQGPLSAVKRVISHPQPLRQARHWLRRHVPQAVLENAASTAEAAVLAAADPTAAAVVGSLIVEQGRLPVLAGPVEDRPDNRTRFWVVARRPAEAGARSALLVTLPHRPGSLAGALEAFADGGINLRSITSRPATASPWEYRFFIDVDGNMQEPDRQPVLDALATAGAHIRLLGVYDSCEESDLP